MERPDLAIQQLGGHGLLTEDQYGQLYEYIEALERERDSLQRMLDRITEQNNRTATEAVRIKRASETLTNLIYAWLLQDANKHN